MSVHEFCCGAGEQFVQQAEALLWQYVDTDNDEAADAAANLLSALLPAVLAYGDARAAEALLVADGFCSCWSDGTPSTSCGVAVHRADAMDAAS